MSSRILSRSTLSFSLTIFVMLPIVNECKGELTEVAGNLRVLFHNWCRKLTELGLRNTPNCTHLAVYLVSSPERTVNGGPGRPKYESMKRLCYTSELWDISGRHRRTSSRFALDPVATGTRAWYQRGNWLYNYRKYRS